MKLARIAAITAVAILAAGCGPTDSIQHGVHPGAFCRPEGAAGVTDAGTSMVCADSGSGLRWRGSEK